MVASSIETERLVLRPLRVSDADEMVAVLADRSLYEFTGGEPPTMSELVERYRQQTAGPGTPGEQWYNWVIRVSSDGHAIWFVQATVIDSAADLAWVLGAQDQGRGFATEAVRAVRDWLTEINVRRVSREGRTAARFSAARTRYRAEISSALDRNFGGARI